MQSLNAQLLAFKSSVFDRADAATARALCQAEKEAREEASRASSLAAGAHAPDFTLKDTDGTPHSLARELEKGPVFLLFFKGGWCPYSTLTLRAWEDLAEDIRAAGGNILAIAPQKASRAQQVRDNNGVSFPILIDCQNKLARAFGIIAEVRPLTREILTKLGCDVSEENEDGSWALPRAAEFLISQDGVIRLAHVAPVHFERLEPQDALVALRALTAALAEA
jgi:peroxiredoxin